MSGDLRTSRRSFFGILVGAISTVVGAIMAIPLARFALHPLFHPGGGADWYPLGRLEDFSGGDPVRAEVEVHKVDGWRASVVKQTVWVTRNGQSPPTVFSAICPHLGCVVPWNTDQKMFACPCHKGFFARDGIRVSGPPPRGLDPLPSKVEDGKLWVKYQYFRQLVSGREVIG
jgi:nitrite reductase/ring-hydroxylating ferredoxin subunit